MDNQLFTNKIFDIAHKLYDEMASGEPFDRFLIVRLFADLGRILVNAERTSFWRWDRRNHLLITAAAIGTNTIVINENTGLIGQALRENRVIVTNNPYSSPYFNADVDKKTGFITRSILVMPIASAEGEIIGAYEAINKLDDPEGFEEERDCKCLSIAAIICGLALESKMLQTEKSVSDDANKAKSSFLANMSHEIRTPLNAILGMDEIILREATEEGILSYAADIKTAGKTLLALINDILDFSKIEEGKIEIIPTQYDLGIMINDLINMVQERADKKGLELILDMDENIPCILFGDEIRIKQCILNILVNAVKYTEKGTVTLSIGYEVIDELYIDLKISVKDTGIGMKHEDMDKLFAPFTRIEEERNRNIEGTGLGMSITMQLLTLMNTHLEFDSEYGKGSVFSFSVRQGVVDLEPIGDLEAYVLRCNEFHTSERVIEADGVKILVIDDNVLNIKVFKGLLKKSFMEISEATSGESGLELMKDNKYDLIFLDHKMPGMDGIEVIHRLRADKESVNKDTPVIALTANAISGAREMYISEGFSDFLTKPMQFEKLEGMLEKYLPEGTYTYKEIKRSEDINALLIDDNFMNRKVFKGLLKKSGINISEADSGRSGLELIKKNKYDIIFLDHMMPDMDGIEVMHRIRADKDIINAETPVIAVTANAVSGAREMYMSEGFTDYLAKPVNPANLGRILERYISTATVYEDRQECSDKCSDAVELPQIDGVDWDYALYKLHDAELLKGVVSDYIMTADEDINELNDYFDALNDPAPGKLDDDLHSFEVKVHAMKSSAAMFGATGVSYLAKLLEYAAKDKDIERINKIMPIYLEEREKNLELLREAFADKDKEDGAEKDSIDPMLFKQYLKMLSDAMSTLDTDTADAIMEELNKYGYEKDIYELIKKLEVQVRNLEEDKVNELIQSIEAGMEDMS